MQQALSPQQAQQAQQETVPDFVVGAFNELIVRHLKHGCAQFKEKELVALAIAKAKAKGISTSQDELYDRNWLNVGWLFQRSGWKVVRDVPAYYESYETTFIFTAQ